MVGQNLNITVLVLLWLQPGNFVAWLFAIIIQDLIAWVFVLIITQVFFHIVTEHIRQPFA